MRYGVALVLIMVILIVSSVLSHEITHMQLYHYYGCQNVTIGFHPSIGAYSGCLDKGFVETDDMRFLHSMNEVVSYNFLMHFIVIELMLVMIVYEKMEKR